MKCPECDGTGVIDSGGFTPWDSPIYLPCSLCDATGKIDSWDLPYSYEQFLEEVERL